MARAMDRSAMVEMQVCGLVADPVSDLPVVVLEDADGRQRLFLDVGVAEAPAIAAELEKVALSRPATHDLLKAVIAGCGRSVQSVMLHDLRAGTVYASITLLPAGGGEGVEVDARPSDAIALALRTAAPIWVARRVIRKARRLDSRRGIASMPLPGELDAPDAMGQPDLTSLQATWILESLRDEDFGKWKM